MFIFLMVSWFCRQFSQIAAGGGGGLSRALEFVPALTLTLVSEVKRAIKHQLLNQGEIISPVIHYLTHGVIS